MDHLVAVEGVINASLAQELFVCPHFCNLPCLDDHNHIGIVDGGETVSNDDAGPALPGLVQSLLHYLLTLSVQSRGGLVQEEDLGVPHQSPRYRNPLLLSSRQLCALAAHISIEPLEIEREIERVSQ